MNPYAGDDFEPGMKVNRPTKGDQASLSAASAPQSFERYVDATFAAQFLGMHPKTLARLARKGIVPAHPIGEGNQRRRWRFLISELDAWLRARQGRPV